jgi:hypothetical protein
VATALREAEEEIGLDPSLVQVLGRLPAFHTVSGYRVTPVVGLIPWPLSLRPDPTEVAEVFTLPLAVRWPSPGAGGHLLPGTGGTAPLGGDRLDHPRFFTLPGALNSKVGPIRSRGPGRPDDPAASRTWRRRN